MCKALLAKSGENVVFIGCHMITEKPENLGNFGKLEILIRFYERKMIRLYRLLTDFDF